ncbi:hypothetical protein HYH03_015269 [Edaphochlamys debaryana]|uniref:Uncharacterized protein n=1 Tax=Edaphochlamys debaryana TaxID=47281 RepID=A0A835XL34_9CHLO|nr:hypothetical protein HYH03_015269 [Edaphochlamys debaryana]|eukprot:KAG2486063.1 hypothetical protein HYH03_015269 [Edaphochlamys debaryana]
MPPRRSAATAPRAASGSAARSGAAGSGGRSAPSLPAALLSGYKRLPEIAAGLLVTPTIGPLPAGRRLPPEWEGAVRRRQQWLAQLEQVGDCVEGLPYDDGRTAAGVAELVSTHTAETEALLGIVAAGLREGTTARATVRPITGGGGDRDGGGDSGAGAGGGDVNVTYTFNALYYNPSYTASNVAVMLLSRGIPLPASRHALGVLRFARALLATQPFHVLSRCLAVAASNLKQPSGGGGSSGASGGGGASDAAAAAAVAAAAPISCAALDHLLVLLEALMEAALDGGLQTQGPSSAAGGAEAAPVMPPGLAAEVAAAREACAEELARALAESGVVEHAARALLLLQAQGPLRAGDPRRAPGLLDCHTDLWFMSAPSGNVDESLLPPSTAALFYSAVRGRGLQTAVMVYGIGTLRVIDRGPSYGLPAALQTAGLALIEPGKGPCPDTAALRLMLGLLSSGTPLPPPGRGASLALALRTARAAAGSLFGGRPMCLVEPPPRKPATPLPKSAAVELLVASLHTAQRLLRETDTSPRQAEQRREWWWLAGWAVCGASGPAEPEWRRWLWDLVTEPLLVVWPDGCLDLDALPPSAPPEVAAALAGGLLLQLARFISPARADAATTLGLDSAPATELFAACCEGRDSGAQGANGFTLFLAPLLAYGGVGESQALLQSLGQLAGLGAPSPDRGMCGGARKDGAEKAAAARQAAALLRDLGRALRGRGGTGQRAAGVLDPASASSSAAPESPAQRLGRMAA